MSNNNLLFGSLVGILEEDSPSAKNLILNALGADALAKLSETYVQAVNNGVLLEKNIRRNPQVRFNPKPARILHILISEAKCFDLKTLEDAIIDCTDEKLASLENISSLEIHYFKDKPHVPAILLDELRHLHMRLDKSDPAIQRQLESLIKLQNEGAFLKWPRLDLLIATALERANIRLKAKLFKVE